jgi:glycosyltransferase involved in cell wall biosynthesis
MLTWLAETLVDRGYRVVVLSLDSPGDEPAFTLPPGARWYRLGYGSGLWGKARRVAAQIRILRQERVDALIGFVIGADKTVYAAALGSVTPLIAAERNDPVIYRDRLSAPKRLLYWALMRLCRRIVVQLPAYRSGYPPWLRRRIDVIPNPVRPAPASSGAPHAQTSGIVLAVGRLHAQKGFDLLLAAYAEIAGSFPAWELRLVGDGPERADLVAQAHQAGIGERVTFVGELADPSAEMRRADVFAFPSRYEGFPNALAEAMSHGLPCIGYRACKGAAALLEDGQAGRLVDPAEDPAAFAAALRELMADAEKRRHYGEQARAAAAGYDADRIADLWERTIAAAIG